MSASTDRPAARRADRPSSRQAQASVADLLPLLSAAVRAVLTVLVPLVALCVVGWIASVRSTSSLAAVARVGADLWLLAHGASVAIVGGSVGIAPLGLTLLAVWSARRAVRMWLRDQVESDRGVPFWRGLGVFTAGYGVLALLVAAVSRSGVGAAGLGTSLLGGCLVAGTGGLVALWAHRPGLPSGVAPFVVAAWRPAVTACAGLLGAGALVLAAALVHGRADVLALHEALQPGLLGGVLLTLGQALLLPTFAVWGLAWTSGTGFAVGTGTSVAPGGTSLEVLPTIPVFGALPAPGATPALALAALAVPVLAGAGAWWLQARRAQPVAGLLHRCASAALSGLLAGIVVAIACSLASGPVGQGRMSQVGPHALLTGAVVAGEVAAGALLAVLVGRAWRTWRGTKVVVALPESGDRTPGKLLGD
ncbi:cell division protein PerM [Kineococcus sp. SYSU DK003]|uniref:cell division protein PerM n=1 Tax=Kineococcus sp. SYSU DK003 TaxID=3383124 RepID=UPI003D7E927F